MTEVTEPGVDPLLLSMLETVSNPVDQVTMRIEVKGVFAFPEQWKASDEANPNVFGYSLEFMQFKFEKGKIHLRQLTEKEIREADEAKTKKGGKKDVKAQEDRKPTPEQEQLQLQRKAEWDSLSDIDRFNRTSQDPFKSPMLKLQPAAEQKTLSRTQIDQLRNNIQSGDIDIILIRKPELSEQDMAKLKKSKPKNLNLAELFRLAFKGKVNLKQLLSPGFTETTQRIRLEQQETVPEAAQFEMKECYLIVTISTTPSIVPLVTSIKPSIESLFQLPPKRMNDINQLMNRLKGDILTVVKSINQDYNSFLQQQKQQQTLKNTRSKVQVKQVDVQQRKSKFISQFISSGKYDLVKSKVQKIVAEISIDKFRKQRSMPPNNPQGVQKKLAQLGIFFNQQVRRMLDSITAQTPQEVHEDLRNDYSKYKSLQEDSIKIFASQSEEERFLRIATEYEVIRKLDSSEANFQNLVLMNPKDQGNLFKYIQFSLRCKNFEKAETLLNRLLDLSQNKDYIALMAALLIRRRRYNEALTIYTRLAEQDLQNRATYHQLVTIIYEKLGHKKQTVNSRVIAQKMYKIQLGLPARLDQQKNPYLLAQPKPPKIKPPSLLTPEQAEQFQYSVIEVFAGYNMYDMVSQFLGKVRDSPKKELYKVRVSVFNEDYGEALSTITKLLQSDKNNIDLTILKADISYFSQKLFEAEETYLASIKTGPSGEQLYQIYLRLGHTYLKRMAWEDSKAIFSKGCEMRPNSSLCWVALGVSHLKLNQFGKAEEALNLANVFQPLNFSEVTEYLKVIWNKVYDEKLKYDSVGKSNHQNLTIRDQPPIWSQ